MIIFIRRKAPASRDGFMLDDADAGGHLPQMFRIRLSATAV